MLLFCRVNLRGGRGRREDLGGDPPQSLRDLGATAFVWLAGPKLGEAERRLVGLSRFELLTPRLSSVCSNQLSYRPRVNYSSPR